MFKASEVIKTEVPLTTVECFEKDECNGDISISLTSGRAIQYTTARSKQNSQPLSFDVKNGIWIVLEIYGLKVHVMSETSDTSGKDQEDGPPSKQTSHVTDARLDVENNPTSGSGEYVNIRNLEQNLEKIQMATQEPQQNVSTGTPQPVPAATSATGREGEDRPDLKTHFPFLVTEIDTMPFCDYFFAKSIITESQMDEIHTKVRSIGRSEANRALINMIRRKIIPRSVMEEIAEAAHQGHLIEKFYPTKK